MRILYYINLDLSQNKGVLQKIIDQVHIWQNNGCTVRILSLSPSIKIEDPSISISFFGDKEKSFYGKNFMRSVIGVPPVHYTELIKEAKNFDPEIIYFRDIFNLHIISAFLKKFSCPKIYEANTIDRAQVKSGSNVVKRALNLFFFILFQDKIYKKLDGAVAVTEEIKNDIEKKVKNVCIVPNGIRFYNLTRPLRNNAIPNIVFIGSPGLHWHGVDKIIQLAERTQGQLFFHIIGYAKPSAAVPGNINFYGNLDPSDYATILLNADVAISSAAAHRKKITEGSALKIREYLLYKLPVILPYKEVILDEGYEFVLNLPNTEDNLSANVNKIVDFSKKWLNRNIEGFNLEDLIDSKVIEKKRLSFFEQAIALKKS